MCGRFTREYTWKEVHDFLSLEYPPELELIASYNVAPTQLAPACRAREDGSRELVMMRWGFAPAWADGTRAAPINARGETAATSPLFRRAFASQRCLIPASGFYEWKALAKGKQPQYIRLAHDPIMCFAGLWTAGKERDAPASFAIITTDANAAIAPIHDRMPVIIRRERFGAWLGKGSVDRDDLAPLAPGEVRITPVGTRVNSPRVDDRGLIEPVASAELW